METKNWNNDASHVGHPLPHIITHLHDFKTFFSFDMHEGCAVPQTKCWNSNRISQDFATVAPHQEGGKGFKGTISSGLHYMHLMLSPYI